MTVEIYMDRVPITASNFIDLCKTGEQSCSMFVIHQLMDTV